jgi:hypothetical protein
MAANFQHFNELPAELRSRVWDYALQDEYGGIGGTGRTIKLHNFDRASSVSIILSCPYPFLFSVSREARQEAAKLDGNSSEDDDYATDIAFEIAFNFKRDTIYLPERFTNVTADLVWQRFQIPVEQYRLQWLSSLLDDDTLQKIQNLRISVSRPMMGNRAENGAWWRGEGLDSLARGGLTKITLVATTPCTFGRWSKMMVETKLDEIWEVNWERKAMANVWLHIVSKDGSVWVTDYSEEFRYKDWLRLISPFSDMSR